MTNIVRQVSIWVVTQQQDSLNFFSHMRHMATTSLDGKTGGLYSSLLLIHECHNLIPQKENYNMSYTTKTSLV